MAAKGRLSDELAGLQKRLAELDRERVSVLAAIEGLEQHRSAEIQPTLSPQDEGNSARVTTLSSTGQRRSDQKPFAGKERR
jgi:hypothetical protein